MENTSAYAGDELSGILRPMSKTDPSSKDDVTGSAPDDTASEEQSSEARPKEIGGREGPDPTRYGDWEKGGRCIDF